MALGVIADRAGHDSAAAIAGVMTLPRSLGMILATPSAVVASEAFIITRHWEFSLQLPILGRRYLWPIANLFTF
jgi:hypothetical protein